MKFKDRVSRYHETVTACKYVNDISNMLDGLSERRKGKQKEKVKWQRGKDTFEISQK